MSRVPLASDDPFNLAVDHHGRIAQTNHQNK
jgi:hypothetical protein